MLHAWHHPSLRKLWNGKWVCSDDCDSICPFQLWVIRVFLYALVVLSITEIVRSSSSTTEANLIVTHLGTKYVVPPQLAASVNAGNSKKQVIKTGLPVERWPSYSRKTNWQSVHATSASRFAQLKVTAFCRNRHWRLLWPQAPSRLRWLPVPPRPHQVCLKKLNRHVHQTYSTLGCLW